MLVSFINGDQKKPYVFAWQAGIKAKNIEQNATDDIKADGKNIKSVASQNIDAEAGVTIMIDGSTSIKLGKAASLPIARQDDQVLAPPPSGAGTITVCGNKKLLG